MKEEERRISDLTKVIIKDLKGERIVYQDHRLGITYKKEKIKKNDEFEKINPGKERNNSNYIKKNKRKIQTGWIILIIAWIILLIPFPGTGIIGGSLNSVVLILAIVLLVKDEIKKGLILFLCSLIITPIIYLIGIGFFLSLIGNNLKNNNVSYFQKEKIKHFKKFHIPKRKTYLYNTKLKPT